MWVCPVFHLQRICVISLVGFKGNLSVLHILLFSKGLKQTEAMENTHQQKESQTHNMPAVGSRQLSQNNYFASVRTGQEK